MIPSFPEVIDNSMRKDLVRCQKIANWKYELGLQHVEGRGTDKVAGGAFAAGLEAARKAFYVQDESIERATAMGVVALHEAYGDHKPEPRESKTADRMAGALVFYLEKCPFEKEKLMPVLLSDRPAIEVGFNFEIPVQHPTTGNLLTYCGRFDMLAREVDDPLVAWVVDEKTTSQMGDKWANQWFLDSQMTTYCWGARKLLDQHDMQDVVVKGAVINGVAVRALNNEKPYEHRRLPVYREQWEIDRWYEQMLRDVDAWKGAYLRQDHNQVLDHACALYTNPCEYAPLCLSRQPEKVGGYQVLRWNPLTRESK